MSSTNSPWSMSLLQVEGCRRSFEALVDRSVKIGSSCRSIGTVKRVWVVRSQRVCVVRSIKVFGNDKLINCSRFQVSQSMQGGQEVNTNEVNVLAVAGLVTDC